MFHSISEKLDVKDLKMRKHICWNQMYNTYKD